MFSIAAKGPARIFHPLSEARPAWRSHVLSLLPLLVCLCLALLVRIFLIIHTHGAIAGDEAQPGMQAENILRGERPVYYYGQPYMGSLETYFLALMFAIAGPSVFTLRLTTSLISLSLVVLTWVFASALADEAGLHARAKRCFMYVATLVAALPPLYDAVLELRSFGGYVEAIIIMLWLLYSAFRLTQRWRVNATPLELGARWLGIGFLLGLGLWIDPLIAYAVAAIALWLGWFIISGLVKPYRSGQASPRLAFLYEIGLVFVALPGAIVGAAPALYWGYYNKWSNVAYILHNGGGAFNAQRLATMNQVQSLYVRCIAPRVIGGTLPTEPFVTQNHPQVLTAGLVINCTCIAVVVGAVVISLFWRLSVLARLRKLTLLPLIFLACTSVIYCVSSISVASVYAGCGPWDLTGRYVVPLVVALPFMLAAVVTVLWFPKNDVNRQDEQGDRKGLPYTSNTSENVGETLAVSLRFNPMQEHIVRSVLLAAILLVYFGTQSYAYVRSSSHNTFQTSGCIAAPADDTAIINYMMQQHIRYAIATSWVGDPLMFKTDGRILVTQERNRVQRLSDMVLHSDRYSLLFLVNHDDSHPLMLRRMDARQITYRVRRFETMPGKDLIVITPLSQTVSPLDPYFKDAFQQIHSGC